MAVQLCLHKGLAVREPSPNASASPSPTTMRCSWCAAASEPMAQGFQGSLNECATGMRSGRSPPALVVVLRDRASPLLFRNSRQRSRSDRPSHRGRRRRRFVTVSKARPNALAISAAGVAMRVYALRAAAHGAVEPYKIILTGQD